MFSFLFDAASLSIATDAGSATSTMCMQASGAFLRSEAIMAASSDIDKGEVAGGADAATERTPSAGNGDEGVGTRGSSPSTCSPS